MVSTESACRPPFVNVPPPCCWLSAGITGWIVSAILVLESLVLYQDPDRVTGCDINPWVSCGRVMGTWQWELFGFPDLK